MRYYLLFIFSIFISVQGRAGFIAYYNLVNEGEFHMYEGNYELAINNFEMAFELVEQPKARDYYLTAKCYAQLNNEILMFQFLEDALKNGLDKNFVISDSLWFTSFSNTYNFKELLKLAPSATTYKVNQTAEYALNAIDEKFQITIVYDYLWAFKSKDSLPEAYDIKLKSYCNYRDSMQKSLIHYYLNFGMPTNYASQSRLKYLTHFLMDKSVPEMDQVLDILFKNLDKGVLDPLYVATFIDQLVLNGLKPFEYSPGDYGVRKNSIYQSDLNRIITNRKAIGLSTYYYDAPNYSRNHKPSTIYDNIRPEKANINETE